MPKPKIYFACSIRGGGDKSIYPKIVKLISANSTLLTEIFIEDGLRTEGSTLPEDHIYKRDITWIKEANAIIAEVTNPSLGVGYELAYAENLKKPVLTLFNETAGKKLSAMIAGNKNFLNKSYCNTSDIEKIITQFISSVPTPN
jgi:nucleoside 2-deoxyribosyltransferase